MFYEPHILQGNKETATMRFIHDVYASYYYVANKYNVSMLKRLIKMAQKINGRIESTSARQIPNLTKKCKVMRKSATAANN